MKKKINLIIRLSDFQIIRLGSGRCRRAGAERHARMADGGWRTKRPGFDMDERYRQLGTFRMRRTGLKAVSSHRTPRRFARFEGVSLPWRVSDRRVLAGSLGARGIRKDFPIFCFARRTQRKAGAKMKALRRKKAGFDTDERHRQLGTVRVSGRFRKREQAPAVQTLREGWRHSSLLWRVSDRRTLAASMKAQRRKKAGFDMDERYGRFGGVPGEAGGFESGSKLPQSKRFARFGGTHLPLAESFRYSAARARKLQDRQVQTRMLRGGNPRFSYE